MKILSVKINNILSIEDAYVEFDDSGLMLVQGWNHDVGRANGAGKTAIFNAISFALFEKLPRKVTSTEVLRRGAKSGYVEVLVQIAGDQFLVRRLRPKKEVLFYKIVGGNRTPYAVTQQGWEDTIRLSYTQFMVSMYCAQGNATRFLSINDSDKKQFLLQLLNLEEFSSCKTIVTGKISALEADLVSYQSKMDAYGAKIDAYSESLIDESLITANINDLNGAIANLTLKTVNQGSLIKPDLSKYQRLEDDIFAKKTELTRVKAQREMFYDQYRKVNSKIRPFNQSDTCRACGNSLDTSAAKIAHDREVAELSTELASLKNKIDDCDCALTKEKALLELQAKLRDKKKEETREYDLASQAAMSAQSELTSKQKELKELVIKLKNNFDLQSKIKTLSVARDEVANNRANILRDIELYKTVLAIYSPTGAQAYILDSTIDSFNEVVSQYIDFMWSNLSYELMTYKENLKGDVSAKFSEHLTMDGKDISIGSLSGGEFRALSLCVDFALISVMEKQFGISLSPVVLDEPFDGLDSAGKELIVGLLEKLATNRQIVTVDHGTELKSMFSKVISVDKRGGISSVSLQT